ncbi:hypothetical protein SNOUR_41505 [Streptomyces noursei ATCC 11455]|nr:hypothetical protein SNOUR_41505 [Streptomyces noursei ATCC 11455]
MLPPVGRERRGRGADGVAEPLVPARDEGEEDDENLTEAVANRSSHAESEVRVGQAQMTACCRWPVTSTQEAIRSASCAPPPGRSSPICSRSHSSSYTLLR